MGQCLFCGEHPGQTKQGTGVKDFCSTVCHRAWEDTHRGRGVDVIGFCHYNLLPIHELKRRENLILIATAGNKEARRELKRTYRLKAIYDPINNQEVRL